MVRTGPMALIFNDVLDKYVTGRLVKENEPA